MSAAVGGLCLPEYQTKNINYNRLKDKIIKGFLCQLAMTEFSPSSAKLLFGYVGSIKVNSLTLLVFLCDLCAHRRSRSKNGKET